MKNVRLREEMVLVNKVDGSVCVVTDVSTQADGSKIATATYETDTFTEPVKTVAISKDNDICFRIVSDPKPYGIPEGYSVEDGILIKDGKPACEQGYIVIDRIIGALENTLLLLCGVKGEDGKQVYAYNPVRDKFGSILFISEGSVLKNFILDEDNNNNGIIVVDKYARAVRTEDEKEVEYFAFAGEEYTLIKNGSYVDSFVLDEPLEIKRTLSREGKIVIICDRSYEVKDGVICMRKESVGGQALIINSAIGRCNTVNTPEPIMNVTEIGNFEFFGDNFSTSIGFDVRTPLLGVIAGEGFLYYVDSYREDRKQIYVFANADATAAKRIGVERTSDRGNIYTLE